MRIFGKNYSIKEEKIMREFELLTRKINATSFVSILDCGKLKIDFRLALFSREQLLRGSKCDSLGCRHGSVDSSVPTILRAQVCVPSTPSMLYRQICVIFVL